MVVVVYVVLVSFFLSVVVVTVFVVVFSLFVSLFFWTNYFNQATYTLNNSWSVKSVVNIMIMKTHLFKSYLC